MSNPLENKEFRHYLNFKSDDIGRLEISEPVKFDASEFVVEQDGYARHISFMNEEISLEFYEGFYEPTNTPYQLLSGVIVNKLSHCLDYILHYNSTYGFESQIEYILERNGVEFVLGELNFEGSETDELTYFFCKVVQNSKRASVKRREDTKIDGFATENLDGEPISPLTTTNILLKAKPVTQQSEWTKSSFVIYTGTRLSVSQHAHFQQPIVNITSYGIENTLSGSFSRFINTFVGDTDFYNKVYDSGFVDAVQDLTENTMTLSNVVISYYIAEGTSFEDEWSSSDGEIDLIFRVLPTGLDDYEASDQIGFARKSFKNPVLNTSPTLTEYTYEFIGTESLNPFNLPNLSGNADRYDVTLPDSTIELPNLINGSRLCMYYDMGRDNTVTNWLTGQHTMNSTSTAISSVIKGVRYVDLIKQSLLAINGMTLNAPRFDDGGEFYDLFAFSGNLIRQKDDVPFYLTFKDRRENLQFVNADLQVNQDDVFALQYQDFYDNVDNGGFLLATNEKFKGTYNTSYTANLFEYKFKTYEKDRDEENTLDAVHTESQWSPNNKLVKGTKKVEVNDIFDPFAIEAQRRQAVKETTALDGDDKIHVLDCIPLSPSARGGFGVGLTHNIDDDGRVQLLNDGTFNWSLLGFILGSDFNITSDDNTGSYTVYEITSNIVTLTPVSPSSQSFTGVSLTNVDFPYEDVGWTNRTNEDFDLIENLLNPDNFSNLKYTIRRNMAHWESVLNTISMYISDDIKNTEFKNNGLLVTQFDGGTTYTENGNIVLDKTKAILTPKEYNNDLIAEYDDVLALVSKYESIDTVGGFIRVQDTNGGIKKIYPKKLGYNWATRVLNVIGEERYENETVTITKTEEIIYINEVGYSIEQLGDLFYEANGDYIVLFDINNVNLINFTKYDKFIVQEETFENPIDLIQAIVDL